MTRRRAIIGAGIGILVIAGMILYTQLSAMSYASLKSALRTQGATVRDEGIGSQPFLAGRDYRVNVNGAGVDVFEYRTTVEASYDASRISADGSTFRSGFGPFGGTAAIVDFIAPPHWFRNGRVVVLYVGNDSSVLTMLQHALGPQFAGGAAHSAGA